MLLLPTIYQSARGVLLLVLLLRHVRITRLSINKTVQKLWIANFILAFLCIVYGLIWANPGALNSVTVDIFWPILYLYFMMLCHSNITIINLYKVIIYGGLFVMCMNAIFLANEIFFGIGVISKLATALGGRYGIYDGFMEFFMPSADYAPYFVYFGGTLLLLPHHYLGVKNKYIILLVVISLFLILCSGRRASWIVVGLLPFVIVFLMKLCKLKGNILIKIMFVSFLIVLVLYVGLTYLLDMDQMIDEFVSSFDMIDNDSNYERTLQAKALWNDFINNPIFGHGAGYVSSYIRTPEKPWEYELSYNYMLSSRGLIGFFVMIFSYASILWKNIKSVRLDKELAGFLLPPIAGIICLAILNETNPYLGKFDFLWIFFLPIINLNNMYFNKNRIK